MWICRPGTRSQVVVRVALGDVRRPGSHEITRSVPRELDQLVQDLRAAASQVAVVICDAFGGPVVPRSVDSGVQHVGPAAPGPRGTGRLDVERRVRGFHVASA